MTSKEIDDKLLDTLIDISSDDKRQALILYSYDDEEAKKVHVTNFVWGEASSLFAVMVKTMMDKPEFADLIGKAYLGYIAYKHSKEE